mmetsp:Transcript_97736/g.248363  ORF Transcript_97736/g.248363 Transcript_97736/m.248363 type:complete len:351 (+) Transcript_97736:78-1130(+)
MRLSRGRLPRPRSALLLLLLLLRMQHVPTQRHLPRMLLFQETVAADEAILDGLEPPPRQDPRAAMPGCRGGLPHQVRGKRRQVVAAVLRAPNRQGHHDDGEPPDEVELGGHRGAGGRAPEALSLALQRRRRLMCRRRGRPESGRRRRPVCGLDGGLVDVAQDHADAAVAEHILGPDAVRDAVGSVALDHQHRTPNQKLRVRRGSPPSRVEGSPEDEPSRAKESDRDDGARKEPDGVHVRDDGAPFAVVVDHDGVHPTERHDPSNLKWPNHELPDPPGDGVYRSQRQDFLPPPHAAAIGVTVPEEVLGSDRCLVHGLGAHEHAHGTSPSRVVEPCLDVIALPSREELREVG